MTDTPNIITSTSDKGHLQRAMKPVAALLLTPTLGVALALHPIQHADVPAHAPAVGGLPDAVLPDPDHGHQERSPAPPQERRAGIETSATSTSVPPFNMDGWRVFRLQ